MSAFSGDPNNNDDMARYWFYGVGVNVQPQPTKTRDEYKFNSWSEWKNKPIPESLFEQWIAQGRFRNAEGMGIIPGRVWRGKYAGKYLIALDCDNKLAGEEFRHYFQDAPFEEIAMKFIIEHHDKDDYNPERFHAYAYSEIPVLIKTSDKNGPSADDLEDNKKPAYELKGDEPATGIMFATNSQHKNEGERYRIVGTTEPMTLTAEQAEGFTKWLDETCRKYGLEYFKTDTKGKRVTKGLTPTQLFEESSYTIQGHNRKNALIKLSMSIINGMKGKVPLSTMKRICFEVLNDEHCKPPISWEMFDGSVWPSVLKYIPPDPLEEMAARKQIELLASEDYEEPLRHLIAGDMDDTDETRVFIEIRRTKDKSDRPIRCVQEFRLIPAVNKETKQKFDVEKYGQIILNAIPVLPGDLDDKRIHVIYDPLFKVKRYKMAFESLSPDTRNVTQTDIIGPVMITELRNYLKDETDFVIDSRPIIGKLNAMIQACIENGYARYSEEIGPEGFFWHNDKIVSSHLNLNRSVTKESVRAAIDVLLKMQKEFYTSDRDKQRLGHYLKLFAVGPFEYVRKQLGWSKQFGWTPRGELTGDTRVGKSEFGRLSCYIWRLDTDTHVLPKRSIDSEARVSYSLAQTTMTLTFQEPDFLFGDNRRRKETSDKILSTLKNSVEEMKGFRLTSGHEPIDEHYLAHYLITHNSRPIAEDGISTRFIIDQFKKSDKKTNKEHIKEYTKFINDNLDSLGGLGDFIAWYVCSVNPEVLKLDWISASKAIWKEMFKYAGFEENEYPSIWLDYTIQDSAKGGTGLSDTDLDDQRRELLRASFQRMFVKLWGDGREFIQSLPLEDRETKSNIALIEQINWLIGKGKIPGCIAHPSKGLCFTTAILNILQQNYGLDDDRIKFSDLEELCGFVPGYVRPTGGSNMRIQSIMSKELADFIRPKLEEVVVMVESGDDNSGGDGSYNMKTKTTIQGQNSE
jgi:hypothetical protein